MCMFVVVVFIDSTCIPPHILLLDNADNVINL